MSKEPFVVRKTFADLLWPTSSSDSDGSFGSAASEERVPWKWEKRLRLQGHLKGLDALSPPNIRGAPWWINTSACALAGCSYPVLNAASLVLSPGRVLVAGRALHGYSLCNRCSGMRDTTGTVLEWSPMFSSLVLAFYTIDDRRLSLDRPSLQAPPHNSNL
jgi:hypothetical protein